MAWDCPACGFNGNDDGTVRCSCGHELMIQEAPPNYNKIDGALIFVAAGLAISIITTISSVTDEISKANSSMQVALSIIGIIFALIPFALLVILFKKKRKFPTYIRIYYLLNLGIAYLNYISAKSMPDIPGKIKSINHSIDVLAITFVGCCIWVTYFSISARVKKTFIR